MVQKVYLKAKTKNMYLIATIIFSAAFIFLNVLYFYKWINNTFEDSSMSSFFFTLIYISFLGKSLIYYSNYQYSKHPIIEYSNIFFQVNKWNLRSKTQKLQTEEVEAKILNKGTIEIHLQPRAFRLHKNEISKEDYQNLLSYLNLE